MRNVIVLFTVTILGLAALLPIPAAAADETYMGGRQVFSGLRVDENGNLLLPGNVTAAGFFGSGGGLSDMGVPYGSQWTTTTSNRIYYQLGSVGIGVIPSTDYDLDVGADVRVQGDLIADADLKFASASEFEDVSPEGLLLSMSFNTETIDGSIALDSSGYSRHGTLTATTATATGGFNGGGYLSFDGATARNNIPSITLGGDFTLSFWANPLNTPAGSMVYDDTTEDVRRGGVYTKNPEGVGTWFIRETAADGGDELALTPVTTGTWQMVTITQSGNTCTMYHNGVQGAQDASFDPIARIDDIGFGDDANEISFNGGLDEMRIYNRALSADEVRSLYLSRAETHNSFLSQKFARGTDDGSTETITIDGNVWVGNNVSALSFTDRTKGWRGTPEQALTGLVGVRTKAGGGIDHGTIPVFARGGHVERRRVMGDSASFTASLAPGETVMGEVTTRSLIFGSELSTQTVTVSEGRVRRAGRDLGAMITMQTAALKALRARNNALKNQVQALSARMTALEMAQ